MGEFHEETAIRSPVSSVHKGLGSGPADHRDSAWRVGNGQTASVVRGVAVPVKRGSLAGGATSVGRFCGKEFTPGVRKGFGGATGASSVHREEVGRGHSKKTRTQEMKHW